MNEPRTLTEAIQRINDALSKLSWTDRLYGRASILDVKGTGATNTQLVPMVLNAFTVDGEYIDCLPNDEVKSVLFYLALESEQNDYNQAAPFGHAPNHILRPKRKIRLIGWVNMSGLSSYSDGSGFPEAIKVELKNVLRSVRCVIAFGDYMDGSISDVFSPIKVSSSNRKYDRWPFVCFRLDLVIQTIETNATSLVVA